MSTPFAQIYTPKLVPSTRNQESARGSKQARDRVKQMKKMYGLLSRSPTVSKAYLVVKVDKRTAQTVSCEEGFLNDERWVFEIRSWMIDLCKVEPLNICVDSINEASAGMCVYKSLFTSLTTLVSNSALLVPIQTCVFTCFQYHTHHDNTGLPYSSSQKITPLKPLSLTADVGWW